jgi:non-ribosomal peptide synthetase component E (peptide arylation enzyme)
MKPTRYTDGLSERARKYFDQVTWQEMWNFNAQKYPDKEAIVSPQRRVTWAEAKRWSDRVALGLIEMGFKRDDVVGLQLPNTPEAMMLRAALRKAGIVGFVAALGLREWEMEQVLPRVDARGMTVLPEFGGRDYLQRIQELRPKLPRLEHIFVVGDNVPEGTVSLEEMSQRPLEEKFPVESLERQWIGRFDVHEVWTTSGTTGMPKILESVNHPYPNGIQVVEIWKLTQDDVCLLLTPHSGGVAPLCFNPAFVLGTTLVMIPSFDAEEALKIIEKERVTFIVAVPTQLEMMINHPDLGKYDQSSLRVVCYSGAVLSPATAKLIEEKLGCRIVTCYGGVEFSYLTLSSPDEPEEVRWSSVGKACDFHEAKVVDGEGNEMPQGEVGELIVKTPNTGGYHKELEATLAAWSGEPDGYFRTGDLAKVDKEGNYYIVGRIKDVYKRGGWTIAPAEVEGVLSAHPKVASVAIVGMPDPLMGERGCAFVIPKAGSEFTFEEMIAFLQENKVASYKLPERLEIMSEFPMSSGQKVLKRELIAEITEKLKAEGKIQ